jgi:c-di-GMP-related signal transduction protein
MTQAPNTVIGATDLGPLDTNQLAIARQAILDHERQVVGYELFDRSKPAGTAYTAASDAEMLFNVLSFAGNEAVSGKKTVFINCTHESLAGGHLELVQPDRVVLEVPPIATEVAEDIANRAVMLGELRKRGFRLAFNQTVLKRAYAPWLPLASYIKLELNQINPATLELLVRHAQTHNAAATIVAEKVETQEQFEKCLKYGVKLFQGYWFAKPTVVQTNTVRPAQATIIQLINLVRKQATTGEIEELLKKDPTLSFNLLRFINSAGFGLNVEITSFRHAVMLLGLKKLFRWAALLMTTSKAGGAPPAVGTTAVVRGRLMELLATDLALPQDDIDNCFVVGVFSLLDVMLGVPMAKALESVSLPQPVVDALLSRIGPYAEMLKLTEACESADDKAFAHGVTALALTNHQANWAHLNALAWADSME